MRAIPPLPFAKPQEVGLSAERLTRMAAVFEREIEAKKLPGVVTLISRYGKIAHFQAAGQRDPASGAPMTPDSIFRIYSMTKPIVSVGVMMLLEEGRLLLSDPVAKYIPAFADAKVAVEGDGIFEDVAPARAPTLQDLLRHTSGISYEFLARPRIAQAYMQAKVYRRNWTNAEHADAIARLPLANHPGTAWDYSRSTDILGRIVEVVSGQPLGQFLKERILEPLGMNDTAFFVRPEDLGRVAEPFATDPDTGEAVKLINLAEEPLMESGGGGLASTAMDYARFLQMLLNGGLADDVRILSRKTIEFMTADHLPPGIPINSDLLPPGYGFGLGFAVRRGAGIAPYPGSPGQYYWGGIAGTAFWVDPKEDLFAVMLIQAPGRREHYRELFRNLVHASFGD